jgi:hypothetical protein
MMRILSFLFILFLAACQNSEQKKPAVATSETATTAPTEAQKTAAAAAEAVAKNAAIIAEAKQILTLIKAKDYANLANTFHADGVRFSPYSYIDSTSDLVIKGADFAKNLSKSRKWGAEYGSEEPIKRNTAAYFKRYVYDVDFLSAKTPLCNELTPSGSSIPNVKEVYKDCNFVEFHLEGTNPKFQGMDWRTLFIVMKKSADGKYQLVGLVHNEWAP